MAKTALSLLPLPSPFLLQVVPEKHSHYFSLEDAALHAEPELAEV